jgi:hypothetical protein
MGQPKEKAQVRRQVPSECGQTLEAHAETPRFQGLEPEIRGPRCGAQSSDPTGLPAHPPHLEAAISPRVHRRGPPGPRTKGRSALGGAALQTASAQEKSPISGHKSRLVASFPANPAFRRSTSRSIPGRGRPPHRCGNHRLEGPALSVPWRPRGLDQWNSAALTVRRSSGSNGR